MQQLSVRKNAVARAIRPCPNAKIAQRQFCGWSSFILSCLMAKFSKLVGTTKPTIQAIRERTHWNITNINPIDPVALGLCKQTELDALVQKANAKKLSDGEVMSDDERRRLVSTEQSLGMPDEPRIPAAISGLETFTLADAPEDDEEERQHGDLLDADSFFNLPSGDGEEPAK